MLFNSFDFIFLFFPIVLIFVLILNRINFSYSYIFIIFSSLFFYAHWKLNYLFIIVSSLLFNYFSGTLLRKTRSAKLLFIVVAANLVFLSYYKYLGFFTESLGLNVRLDPIVLPLAISFFTFQQISYVVDSYRGRTEEHSIGQYAFYILFFPQLIAGPIVHHSEMLPQIRGKRLIVSFENFANGISIFAIGLFKKIVIADSLAPNVERIFSAAETERRISFLEAWSGTLSFHFQIYFDFSAYSDMALGLAAIFGIMLPINFYSPYKASSIIDFWRRWHMTLSRFLRDYLYIPLGGNRTGRWRSYSNILIVMLLGGLWHGAGYNFVIWGALHGFLIILNHQWRWLASIARFYPKGLLLWIGKTLSYFLTFATVAIAWIFFRAESMHGALNMLYGVFGFDGTLLLPSTYELIFSGFSGFLQAMGVQFVEWNENFLFGGIREILVLVVLLAIICFSPNSNEIVRIGLQPAGTKNWSQNNQILVWRMNAWWAGVTGALIGISLLFLVSGSGQDFIYFQF